jgi:hypothetical protein
MSDEFKNLVTGLYDLLLPVTDADVRKRAVKSALMMLGDDLGFVEQKQKGDGGAAAPDDGGDDHVEFNAKARTWMRQNNVTTAQLSHAFHGSEVIAHEIPGANKREKTLNTYILTGVGQLLQTGEARFSDDTARQGCEQHGCYDSNNHSKTINKKRGNAFTGTVKSGWQLTTPGLKIGADLVKTIAGA